MLPLDIIAVSKVFEMRSLASLCGGEKKEHVECEKQPFKKPVSLMGITQSFT